MKQETRVLSFSARKELGLTAERAFIDFMQRGDLDLFMYSTNKNYSQPHFDLISYNASSKQSATYEIKLDRVSSPNIAIEIWSNKKTESETHLSSFRHSCNSGIFSTRADYFVIYNLSENAFYMAETRKLKARMLELERPNIKVIDNKRAIILIPKTQWDNFGWVEEYVEEEE